MPLLIFSSVPMVPHVADEVTCLNYSIMTAVGLVLTNILLSGRAVEDTASRTAAFYCSVSAKRFVNNVDFKCFHESF